MKSALRSWKRISTKTLVKNQYVHLEEDIVILPTGEKKKYYVHNRKTRAVSIIVQDSKGRFLLQKEYRYPVGKVIFEFPGGMVEKGESFLSAAKRECEEETGLKASTWVKLGNFYASVSRSGVLFTCYLAKHISSGVKHPDEAEFLEHEWMPYSELRKLLSRGTIVGQTTLAALYLYSLRKP